jgi:hypothetical protein
VLLYWGLISWPCSLSLGQGQCSFSQPHAASMLQWFADCFSILQCCLSLHVAHWLRRWDLWTATCSISGSSLPPARCQPFCLSSLCLLKVNVEMSSLFLPLFSGALTAPCPSALF